VTQTICTWRPCQGKLCTLLDGNNDYNFRQGGAKVMEVQFPHFFAFYFLKYYTIQAIISNKMLYKYFNVNFAVQFMFLKRFDCNTNINPNNFEEFISWSWLFNKHLQYRFAGISKCFSLFLMHATKNVHIHVQFHIRVRKWVGVELEKNWRGKGSEEWKKNSLNYVHWQIPWN